MHFQIKKTNPILIFKALQWRIKKTSKASHCFQIDVTDMMDRCQIGVA